MKDAEHKKAIKESLDVINESVQRGVESRQRTIGFHCSAASADLLELYLHHLNAINPGKVLKHDFFTSEKKAQRKVSEEFPDKDKIIKLIVELETQRNQLCYGKKQPKEKIESYLKLFNSIRQLFESKGVQYDEEPK